ncbi:hypothetical protein WN944_028230 [Citrus x changshan-huyou]|uniref:Uncharacterized protein n=1 Tax=Citrus x changshan-huyou TaxID=2935761 RepID=A0AAP0LJF6_9ROSI
MIRFSKTTHGTDGVVLEVSSTKLMHQSVLEKQDAQQLVRNGPSLPKHLTSHFEPHPHENVSRPSSISLNCHVIDHMLLPLLFHNTIIVSKA